VLEGDDGPRVEAEGARVLAEVAEHVARRQELDHGDARGHVDGVHVVAVHERAEGVADEGELVRAAQRLRAPRALLAEEALEALDRLRAAAQTRQHLQISN